jgi:hypothetical protein
MNPKNIRRIALWAAVFFWAAMGWFITADATAAPRHTAHCSWDNPGHRPFMGNVPGAVDTYAHIPADVRARLKARMQRHAYDDQVTITRDRMTGARGEYTALRMMHFASGETCGTVSRAKWSDKHTERALIYTEGGFTIAVPSVCRNVSIVDAPAAPVLADATPATPAPAAPGAPETPPMAQAPMPPMAQAPGAPIPAESFAAVAEAEGIPGWGWFALAALGLLFGGGAGGHGSTTFLPMPPTHVPGIPEPATWALLVLGVLLVATWARLRRIDAELAEFEATEPMESQALLSRAKRTEPSWSVLHTPGTYVGHVHHIAPARGDAGRPGGVFK